MTKFDLAGESDAHRRARTELLAAETVLSSPAWNLFDLTPEGRGGWFPGHNYMARRAEGAGIA